MIILLGRIPQLQVFPFQHFENINATPFWSAKCLQQNQLLSTMESSKEVSSEKTMGPHSSTLAWKNPMDGGAWWAAVYGVPKSRARLSDFTFTFMHWRRKWQPTPVFSPGESQGQASLVGCRLWGRTKSDTTEAT